LNTRKISPFKEQANCLRYPLVGGNVDSPSKRETAQSQRKAQKRAAHPPSAAGCVRRIHTLQIPCSQN